MNFTDIAVGLSDEEAARRARDGLSNGGFDVKTKSSARIVCENIFTLFNLINLILAVLVISVGSPRNALFMGVVICNTAIGIFQEIRAKRTIDKLSILSAPKARVIRGGKEITVPVGDVVLGDIMILTAGMQICADAVVLSGECETDESLITGESDAVFKNAGNELCSGSFVISGHVKAQAVRVGANSASGRITSGSKYLKKNTSEMIGSINRIIKAVSFVIVPFGAIMLYKSVFVVKQSVEEGVTAAAASLIGMIPEGLVLLTGIALAVSAVRLSKRQALCQDLYCVESLAYVDVLCLDKTGTLTEGCMELSEVVPLDSDPDTENLISAFASAFPEPNSTLRAIKERFHAEQPYKLLKTVPFSSARKWSAAEFEQIGTLVLGAPEFVIKSGFSGISDKCGEYSKKGFRTLLLACSPLPIPEETGKLPEELSPKALIVLSDKLRDGAPAAVDFFKNQGVELKIISGDDPAAVSGTAARAGVPNADCYVDMSGLADELIPDAAVRYTVFGRTSPEQKLALVRALKSAGHKVAMTGDGVNDVPALREADCSVAMQSGSDAARAVSRIVLMSSDLSAMPPAVEEGRRCINNIRRSAALFLTKTIFSFLLTAVYLFLPLNYPFKPIQLTLLSAVIIGIPSFLLAMEPNKNRVENGFLAHVIRKSAAGSISATLGVGLLTAAEAMCDLSPEQTSTMAVFITAAAFFGTLFHVCRPFSKPRGVMFVLLGALFLGAAFALREVFYLVRLTWEQILILCVIAAAVILVQAALRQLFDRIRLTNKTN